MRDLLRRHRCGAIAVALTAVALIGACGDDDGGASPTTASTTTRPSTSSTTASLNSEDAVLASYRGFWDAYLEAADPMNPQHPALQEHATGEELQQVTSAFLARLSAGEVIRGEFDLAPHVVSMNESTATVSDCYLDRTGIYDAATGARHDQESGVRHLITAELTLEEGSWKVATITREGDGCTPESNS